jgi:hypothetical protein
MKTFRQQINQAIKNQSLVELHFYDTPKWYNLGIILFWSKKFFLFAKIDPNKKYDALSLCAVKEISMVRFNSPYLSKFSRKIDHKKIKLQIKQKAGELIKEYDRVDMSFLDLTDWLSGKQIKAEYMFLNGKIIDGVVDCVDKNNYVFLSGKQGTSVFDVEAVVNIKF